LSGRRAHRRPSGRYIYEIFFHGCKKTLKKSSKKSPLAPYSRKTKAKNSLKNKIPRSGNLLMKIRQRSSKTRMNTG